jgi:hypothetical protein
VTEEQWFACTDPAAILEVLRCVGGHARKVRFFIIACMVRSLAAYGGPEESTATKDIRMFFVEELANPDLYAGAKEASLYAAEVELDAGGMMPSDPGWVHVYSGQLEEQANVLRDIVGNPFREVTFEPSWHSPAVTEPASFIDRNGAFHLMPALGAALSDAGCNDPVVLQHCRLTDHVSGCWLVSALLGRERAKLSSAGEQV